MAIQGGRTYNLDLLRIVAMFMIVALHYLGKGQIFTAYPISSLKYDAIRIIESICLVSVNCYVLLSGYFLVHSDFKIKKLFSLLLQVLFYSLGIYLLFITIGFVKFSSTDMFNALFPTLSGVYWFITIYIGMYILSPFLNKLLLSIDRQSHLAFITVLIAIFSLWPTFFVLGDSFTFAGINIDSGCSVIWFITLYCIAAYIRQYYKPTYAIRKYIVRYVITATIVAIIYVTVSYLGSTANNTYFAVLFSQMQGYNTVPILVASICLFMLFINLKIKSNLVNRSIALLSPLTLGVYLIHDEPHVRAWLWSTLNPAHHAYHSRFIFFSITAITVIYITCSAIDWLRLKLFITISRMEKFQLISDKMLGVTKAIIDKAIKMTRYLVTS